MTSIRNLPLAARLGGAFGVLCVAVAIVAFTGTHAMSGLRAETDELGERHLPAAQLLGGMQTRAKDNVSLIAQHLYVRDGDLAAQDEIIDGDRGQLGQEQGRRRQARASSSRARRAEDEYAAFVADARRHGQAAEAGARRLAPRDGVQRRGPRRARAPPFEQRAARARQRAGGRRRGARRRDQRVRRRGHGGRARRRRLRHPHHPHRRAGRDPRRDRASPSGSPARSCARSARSAAA